MGAITIKTHKYMSQELEYIPLDESDKYFPNSDIGLSAGLIEHGYEMVSIDKGESKARFIFKGKKGIGQAVHDYWNGKLQVNALGYFNTLKRLKSQIYSE